MSSEIGSSSSKEVIKSSFLVGGSQAVGIVIGLVKNKALAMFLGTTGIGIMGVFNNTAGLITSFTNLGIGASGVRQIAESNAENNLSKLRFVIAAIRALMIFSSLITMVCMILFRDKIAELSFAGKSESLFTNGIIVIAFLVLFDNLTSGEKSILQGARELKYLSLAQVYGSIFGAIAGIVIIYMFGIVGISFFLLVTSAFTFFLCRFYVSKSKYSGEVKPLADREKSTELKKLLSIGAAFLVTVLAGNLVAYITRILIIRQLGLDGVGIYQSAWSVINMSFNLVLVAMATDFYPRLVKVADDRQMIEHSVNQQVKITLIAALPIVLILYTYSPLILTFLYTEDFVQGADLARWLSLSCFLRILCWPLGYITLAKNKKVLFMVTSIIWEFVHIPLIVMLMQTNGLNGIGISYLVAYSIVVFGASAVAYYFFKFQWQRQTVVWTLACIALLVPVVLCQVFFPGNNIVVYSIGSLMTLLSIAALTVIFKKHFDIDLFAKVKKWIS